MDNKTNYSDLTKYSEMIYSPVTYLNYPVRDSLCFVIPLTFIYSIIFISGILGNVITCVVITRNKNMHTATNYYLFSLAVSDLLLLVSGKCWKLGLKLSPWQLIVMIINFFKRFTARDIQHVVSLSISFWRSYLYSTRFCCWNII